MKNIIVIGFGPHFKKMYAKHILERHIKKEFNISFIVDLEVKRKDISSFLGKYNLSNIKQIYLPEKYRNNLTETELLKILPNDANIDMAIISAEPKVKIPYYTWCIKRNISIFTDKPLSVIHPSDGCIYEEFLMIKKMLKTSQSNFVISCERREHYGYLYVTSFIENFIKKYGVPITHIDIQFSGGNWMLPEEFYSKESHPFKYQYGILFHSGYHYIDLLAKFLSINNEIMPKFMDNHLFEYISINPIEVIHLYNYGILNNIPCDKKTKPNYFFGENDFTLIGKFFNKGKAITTSNLTLLGNSFSTRSDFSCSNPYTETTGRVRQEKVTIHLGPLCSIHISSLPFKKVDSSIKQENFDINILTHPTLTDEKNIIQINRQDLSNLNKDLLPNESMNKKARLKQLNNFLENKNTNSNFHSHEKSIKLLKNIQLLNWDKNERNNQKLALL